MDRFGLKPTLILDSVTFFLSFLLLFSIREEEKHITTEKRNTSIKSILRDIKEGMIFIVKEKEIFFLLVIASMVNFFIAAFNYLAPFSNQLFVHPSSYATLLTMGAAGSIAGAVLANKLFKNSYNSILIALALCGVGLAAITIFAVLGLPAEVIVTGNLIFEFFLTIFNIHFFFNGAEKSTKTHAGKSVQLDFYGCGDLHADFNCDHDSTSVFHQHLCVCGDRGGHSACVWRWISL